MKWKHLQAIIKNTWKTSKINLSFGEALQFFRRSQRLAALQILLARQAAQRTAQVGVILKVKKEALGTNSQPLCLDGLV